MLPWRESSFVAAPAALRPHHAAWPSRQHHHACPRAVATDAATHCARTPPPPPPAVRIADTLRALHAAPVILCVRAPTAAAARAAAAAALAGGLRALEVTLTTPHAASLIAELGSNTCSSSGDRRLVGAGTVLTTAELHAARAAGASFAMSPVTDTGVIAAAAAAGVLALPGAFSPTEVLAAARAAAPAVKLFPAALAGGPRFARALLGPLPHVPLVPTGCESPDQLREYLALPNVLAVGVSAAVVGSAYESGNWDAVTRRARMFAEVAAEAALWRQHAQ